MTFKRKQGRALPVRPKRQANNSGSQVGLLTPEMWRHGPSHEQIATATINYLSRGGLIHHFASSPAVARLRVSMAKNSRRAEEHAMGHVGFGVEADWN